MIGGAGPAGCGLAAWIGHSNPYFLEVNTIPGLTAQSIVPQQLAVAGISLADFFDALLKNTLKKN